MAMHGPTSNKSYVKRTIPFAKAKGHRGMWQIFDSRSKKVLSETCESEARAWRSVATKMLANGGSLIDHGSIKAIVRVRDKRGAEYESQ